MLLMPVSPLVRCGIVGVTSCWGEEDWGTQELLVTYVSLCPVRSLNVEINKLPIPVRGVRMGWEARDKSGCPGLWFHTFFRELE